jgi:hypothetical protein
MDAFGEFLFACMSGTFRTNLTRSFVVNFGKIHIWLKAHLLQDTPKRSKGVNQMSPNSCNVRFGLDKFFVVIEQPNSATSVGVTLAHRLATEVSLF